MLDSRRQSAARCAATLVNHLRHSLASASARCAPCQTTETPGCAGLFSGLLIRAFPCEESVLYPGDKAAQGRFSPSLATVCRSGATSITFQLDTVTMAGIHRTSPLSLDSRPADTVTLQLAAQRRSDKQRHGRKAAPTSLDAVLRAEGTSLQAESGSIDMNVDVNLDMDRTPPTMAEPAESWVHAGPRPVRLAYARELQQERWAYQHEAEVYPGHAGHPAEQGQSLDGRVLCRSTSRPRRGSRGTGQGQEQGHLCRMGYTRDQPRCTWGALRSGPSCRSCVMSVSEGTVDDAACPSSRNCGHSHAE